MSESQFDLVDEDEQSRGRAADDAVDQDLISELQVQPQDGQGLDHSSGNSLPTLQALEHVTALQAMTPAQQTEFIADLVQRAEAADGRRSRSSRSQADPPGEEATSRRAHRTRSPPRNSQRDTALSPRGAEE